MTESEFIKWYGQEGVRAEWLDGEVVFMSPVAGDHADLSIFLIRLIGDFVEEHDLGKVGSDPFQVRLPKQHARRSPDLFFARTERLNLFEKHQFNGAPDLVIEIISPESKIRDKREKYAEYEAAGVREYWIVDPLARRFEAFTLATDGRFELIQPTRGATHSLVLQGLFFQAEWVWMLKFPKVSGLLKQMSRRRKKLLSSRKG